MVTIDDVKDQLRSSDEEVAALSSADLSKQLDSGDIIVDEAQTGSIRVIFDYSKLAEQSDRKILRYFVGQILSSDYETRQDCLNDGRPVIYVTDL